MDEISCEFAEIVIVGCRRTTTGEELVLGRASFGTACLITS